jgi:hypothetical protein
LDGYGGGDYADLGKTNGECGGVGDFVREWAVEQGGMVRLKVLRGIISCE